MVPIHLFGKLVSCTGENAFTEVLGGTLGCSSRLRNEFLARLNVKDDGFVIETQPLHFGNKGRPDIQISSASCRIFCEIKVEDKLRYNQWIKYQQILDSEFPLVSRHLVGIIAARTEVDERIWDLRPEPRIWFWSDICRMAQRALQQEADPVGVFLLTEFLDLLESHNMAPFEGFTPDDVRVVQGVEGLMKRMQLFFNEIVLQLQSQLQKSLPDAVRVTNGGFTMRTYKEYPVLYPEGEFEVRARTVTVKGSIDFECKSGDTTNLLLYLWKGEGRASIWKSLESHLLNDRGFTMDNEEECPKKVLETHLTSKNAGSDLVSQVAREVANVLSDLVSRTAKRK